MPIGLAAVIALFTILWLVSLAAHIGARNLGHGADHVLPDQGVGPRFPK